MKSVLAIIMFFCNLTYNIAFASQNSELICYNSSNNTSFSINTGTATIIYNNEYAVLSPVFSGVTAATGYNGEILGEINLGDMSYYITMIVRNNKEHFNLESIWYPKNNSRKVLKIYYNKCVVE